MREKSSIYKVFDNLSLWAISLFALECVLGCSGKWLSFGSFSIRMVLFTLCFLVTIPNVFRQLRTLIRSPHVIIAVLFGFYLTIAAFIGWRRNNSTHFIIADITGFLTLALMPGFLATICTAKRIRLLTDIIFWGALVLGIITTVMHFCFAYLPGSGINTINNWINDHHMGGLATLQTGMQRIYLRSQIFLQVGLMIGLYKAWCASDWKRWFFFWAEGVIVFSCLMSLTRGFWLGFAVSAVLLLLLCPQYWKKYLSTVGIIAAVVAGFLCLSWYFYGQPAAIREVAGRFNPALISGAIIPPSDTDVSSSDHLDSSSEQADSSADHTVTSTPDSTDDSNTGNKTQEPDQAAVEVRRKTLQKLKLTIRENPILGSGLGTNLDGVRDGGKTEYMYQDTLMKVGLVGFLLFLAVFFLPSLLLLLRAARALAIGNCILWDSPDMLHLTLAVAFIGVAVTSYVNPFLTNPMGILLVLLTTAAISQTKSKNTEVVQ